MLTILEITAAIRELLARYRAEYALLFGSYARGDATEDSDVDVVVFGGPHFKRTNIFAFAEDLCELLGKNVDVFEISEVDEGTSLYETIMREGKMIS